MATYTMTHYAQNFTLKAGDVLEGWSECQYQGTLTGAAGSLLKGEFNFYRATLKGVLTLTAGAKVYCWYRYSGSSTKYGTNFSINADTTIICQSGSHLSSNAYVEGALQMERGTSLEYYTQVYVYSGGRLQLNGCTLSENNRLTLCYGSQLNIASGTTINSTIHLNSWSGDTQELCAQLSRQSAFSKVMIGSTSKNVVLRAISGAGGAFWLYSSSNVQYGTLTLASGAVLGSDGYEFSGTLEGVAGSQLTGTFDLSSATLTGTHTLAAGAKIVSDDTVVLESGTSLICQQGSELSADVQVKSGGVLKLNGASVSSEIALEAGAQVVIAAGTQFLSGSGIRLVNWVGSTQQLADMLAKAGTEVAPDLLLSGNNDLILVGSAEKTITYVQDGSTMGGTLKLESGAILRGNGNVISGTLTAQAGSQLAGRLNLDSVTLKGTVTLAEDAQLLDGTDSFCVIGKGVKMICQKGSDISAAVLVESGGILEVKGAITDSVMVKSGGVLRLKSAQVSGTIILEAGARIECGDSVLMGYGYLSCESGAVLKGALWVEEDGMLQLPKGIQPDNLALHLRPGVNMMGEPTSHLEAYIVPEPYLVTLTRGGSSVKGSLAYALSQANANANERYDITFDASLAGQTVNVPGNDYIAFTNPKSTIELLEGMTLDAGNHYSYSDDGFLFSGKVMAHYQKEAWAIDADSLRVSTEYGLLDFKNASIDCSEDMEIRTGGTVKMQGGTLVTPQLTIAEGSMSLSGGTLDATTTTVEEGGKLTLLSGATVDGNISLNTGSLNASDTHFLGNVNCSTGTTVLRDCSIDGHLIVASASEASKMTNVVFRNQETLRLTADFRGSTASLWTSKRFTATQPDSFIRITGFGGTLVEGVTLAKLSDGMVYRLNASGANQVNTQVAAGAALKIKAGVVIDMQDARLDVAGNLSAISNTVATDLFVYRGEAVDAQSAIIVRQDGVVDLKNANVRLDSTQGLLSVVQGGKFTMSGGTLSVGGAIQVDSAFNDPYVLAGQMTLKNVLLTSPTAGEGRGVVMNICGKVNLTNVTVAPGARIELTNRVVAALNPNDPPRVLAADFDAQNVVFGAGTQLNVGSSCEVTLSNCRFAAGENESVIQIGNQTKNVTITKCDLSNASLVIVGMPFENCVVDLRGNYWGTNDLEEIKSRIIGYDSAYVLLGNLRDSAPSITDKVAPELTLGKLAVKKVSSGKASVTFNWTCNEKGNYVLTVDGEKVYEGKQTKATQTLTEGLHEYTIKSTDAAGNSSVYNGWLRVDVTLPTLPTSPRTKLQNAGAAAVLSWNASEDVSGVLYDVAIKHADDSEYTYHKDLAGTNITLDLLSAGSYKWGVRAKDGAGNVTSWVWADVFNSTDFELPKVTNMSVSQKRAATGKATVTLTWKCNETSSYVVMVGDEEVYAGKDKTASFVLKDGYYKYTIIATDAAGNVAERTGAFRVDTTAPAKPTSLKVQVQKDTKQIALSWGASKDVSGVTYELAYKAEGATYYSYCKGLTSTSQVLKLADNTYEWRVRAKDGKGNYSDWVYGSDVKVDFTAPKVTGMATSQKKTAAGQATITLTWKSNEAASYVVKVGGKQVYAGSGKKASFSLADGYYKYSIVATDDAGNSATRTGAFRVDTAAPTKPKAPIVRLQDSGKTAVFSWGAATDVSGVTYDLALKLPGSSSYTHYKDIDGTQTSLKLSKKGTYKWGIRAKDGKGNVTSWVWADSFNSADTTAPKVSYMATTQKKTATGKATVTLTWKCNETASYVVKVGNKQVYAGSDKKASFSLADGYHKYSITATDTVGNVSTRTGAFRVDTKAPAKAPSSLRVQLTHGGTRVTLRWTGSHDISGVTYDVAFKKSTDSEYTHYTSLEDPSLLLTLAGTGEYKWGVRARDGKNNVTSWVWGDSFSNSSASSASPAAAAVASLDQELDLSSGMAALSDCGCGTSSCLGSCTQELELTHREKTTQGHSLLA